MNYENIVAEQILEAGRRMYKKNFVAANDGNISARLNENEILITATGICKGDMNREHILKVDMDGRLINGSFQPTSEMKMHLTVYRNRPDVAGVVHAHPQKATAFAVARIPMDKICLPEVVFTLGSVALADYGTPSTNEIPDAVNKHIGQNDVILLSNHGALAVGRTVMDAYFKMETLEHFAAILIEANNIGGAVCLSDKEVDRLREVRRDVFKK